MSKYKVGDKIVMEITKIFSDNFGTKDCIVKGFTRCDENCLSEHSEPLSTYTLPLEDKIYKQEAEITRLLAENERLKEENKKLLCKVDSYELYGDQHEEEYNQAFNQGAEAAWELARKIVIQNGYSSHDLYEIFESNDLQHVLENYTYPEAAAKVEEWEKAKEEIKVGDILATNGGRNAVVTKVFNDGDVKVLFENGKFDVRVHARNLKKTGRHIDIDGFLKQIGGGDDEK